MSTRLHHLLLLLLSVFALAILLPVVPVKADLAPPEPPPGASLVPGHESTRVRMLAEKVLIEVFSDTPDGNLSQARVSAVFRMQNLGQVTETMAVRFPINDSEEFFEEITELQVLVGGDLVTTRESPIDEDNDDRFMWVEFKVTFPPGETVIIEVSYLLQGSDEYPFTSFTYLLETGAGWAGTIGDVEIILQLPYEASQQNVILYEETDWPYAKPNVKIDNNQVRWHFEELEPFPRMDNLYVSLVTPSAWANVLRELDNVAANPGDGEACGRLGLAYKEVIYRGFWMRSDQGGRELYELSKDAYQKAVDLLPDDPGWHANYAELLWRGETIEGLTTSRLLDIYRRNSSKTNDRLSSVCFDCGGFHPKGLDELLMALRELDRTLQLDPNNELAHEILYWLLPDFPGSVRKQGDGYSFLWLTATPSPTWTLRPSVEPSLTLTQTQHIPPTSTPLPPAFTPIQTSEEHFGSKTLVVEPPVAGETELPNTTKGGEESSLLPMCGAVLLILILPISMVVLRRWL